MAFTFGSFISLIFLALIVLSTLIAALAHLFMRRGQGQSTATLEQFDHMNQTDTITFLRAVRFNRKLAQR